MSKIPLPIPPSMSSNKGVINKIIANDKPKLDSAPLKVDNIEYEVDEYDLDDAFYRDLDEMSRAPYNDFYYSGWIGDFNLDYCLSLAILEGASDVHITSNSPIRFTILGDVYTKGELTIPDAEVLTTLTREKEFINFIAQGIYDKNLECDASYEIRFGPFKGRRSRVSIGKTFGNDFMVFRIINNEIPKPESLGLNQEQLDLTKLNSGSVLICGTTGSGKTTSLASILRYAQLNLHKKIVTIENPIEYIYPDNGKGFITQRSIPEDTHSYVNGIVSALRQAPDIILMGEARGKEEIDNMLVASETGHLVFTTIHSSNNVSTLSRIRSLYNSDDQKRILESISQNIKVIINQTLVKHISGTRRFAVRETLYLDDFIKKCIREDNFYAIREMQEKNKETMEHTLIKLYKEKEISLETCLEHSPNRHYVEQLLKGLEN